MDQFALQTRMSGLEPFGGSGGFSFMRQTWTHWAAPGLDSPRDHPWTDGPQSLCEGWGQAELVALRSLALPLLFCSQACPIGSPEKLAL